MSHSTLHPELPPDPQHPDIMSGEAWRKLCKSIEASERFVLGEGVPDSPRDRAEGFRYLARFLHSGVISCLSHDDPDYPVLGRMIDYTAPWGLDNPDCLYLYAPLRGDASYRLWGNRGGANHIDIQANTGHYSLGEVAAWRTMDSIDKPDLVTDADGNFELILSAEDPESGDNWLKLEPDAGFLLIRQYFSDWENERPADLLIERIGATFPIPNVRTDFVAERLAKLQSWIEKSGLLWETMSKAFLGLPPNSINIHMPEAASEHSGMRGQAYGMGNFACKEGEAVIVEFVPPECRHWGVALANWYWENIEYGTRQGSLNGHQAQLDSDGAFRGVICAEDPGVPNWLDTAGNERGTLAIRFLDAVSVVQPTFKIVPIEEVGNALPSDTPRVTPEERQASLRRRYHAVLRRFRE